MKLAVTVSDEMITMVGYGSAPDCPLPDEAAMFLFEGFSDEEPPSLTYRDEVDLEDVQSFPLVFIVKRAACCRLFPVQVSGCQSWHLPNALRALAISIIDCDACIEARDTLRLARSIELLCQVHAAVAEGTLLPMAADGSFSEMDIARIASARRILDQRWQEKLTIPELSSIVGVNRDKLVRGFRELYGATFSEMLAERRLAEAKRLLLASDLPVATVGYRCSYLNNASFTRAFSRRYGVAPSEMRRIGVAA